MFLICVFKSVFLLKVFCSVVIVERRVKEIDFLFFRDVINEEFCLEFNGYNIMFIR